MHISNISDTGALLAQIDENRKEHTIYYINRIVIGYVLNYTTIERAYLALVFSTQKLWHYMLNNKTKLIAKIDPLKYLLSKAALTSHTTKWVMLLIKFDIDYVDQKSIKGQVIEDQLVEAPLQGDNPLIVEFPNDAIMNVSTSTKWQLYFDGSCTQNGSGVGIPLITPQGDCIPKSYKIAFACTNNIVEYEALITGIHLAIQWKINVLQVYGDSQLVIKQVNNEYQTKDDKLLPYHKMVEDIKQHFTIIKFQQVPRKNNRVVDAMATIGCLLHMPANSQKCEF